ncbi:hypothetical protein K0U00_41440, partial [Paenibacillus sepulcri]|nr:hypothetical protein [Paenibacillus sepulcri]
GALNRKGGQGNIPYVGFAEVEGNMADILVQVSNYSYATGGMIYPILFGDQTAIVVSREWKMTADLAAAVGMSILALYFLVIYRARRGEEQGLLFIGAFCVSALVYVLTHGEKLVANLLPGLSYELVMKLQATSPVIAYYCLFRYGLAFGTGKFHARFYLAINILMGVLLLINLVIPIGLFAVGSVMMTAFSQIVLLYGIYHLIQGIRHRREDAHYILLSMASILVLVSVSCLNVLGLLDDQVFVPYEMLMFIILQAFLMARRFEKTFIEVRQLSRRLLTIDGLRDEFLANTSHELRTP